MLTDQEREELRRRLDFVHEELNGLEDLCLENRKENRRTGEALVDFGKREADLLGELEKIKKTMGEDYPELARRESGES